MHGAIAGGQDEGIKNERSHRAGGQFSVLTVHRAGHARLQHAKNSQQQNGAHRAPYAACPDVAVPDAAPLSARILKNTLSSDTAGLTPNNCPPA